MPEPPAPRSRVVLAVGLPGSGKTTYFEKRDIFPLSSDLLRFLLADDPTEQRYQDIIFIALRYLLRLRLKIGRPVTYIDATNLSAGERVTYVHIAENYGATIEAIFFDVPLEVCQERNRARSRVVPQTPCSASPLSLRRRRWPKALPRSRPFTPMGGRS